MCIRLSSTQESRPLLPLNIQFRITKLLSVFLFSVGNVVDKELGRRRWIPRRSGGPGGCDKPLLWPFNHGRAVEPSSL